ncbi:MAG TPA: hypothetical protein VJV04_07490 [Nitrospiraceae bacterium]|nr:hypothetical protein [Nitrospiraceae bacterium]
MAKHKTPEPHQKDKIFASADEVSQSISKLRARIHQVEELKRDGLPYRDALRVTAEYQLRDSIREIFGERSPEYLQHQHLRIKVNSKHSVNETISLLQHLVVSLEERRMDLLGLRPPIRHKKADTLSEPPSSTPTPHSVTPELQAAEPPSVIVAPSPPSLPSQAIPPVRPIQPLQLAQSSASAEVTPPVQTNQPTMETPAPAMPAPPIILVPQTKLKLSAEAVAQIPEPAAIPAMEPLRFEVTAASGDGSHTQPLSEKSMAPKLGFPSMEPPTQYSEPHHTIASPEPVRNGNGVAGQPGSTATTPTDEEDERDTIGHLRKICSAFHRVTRQLRQRRDERPTLEVEDERDVIDLLHTLLCIEYENIEAEEWTPTYANGSTRTDLWLKDEGVVIIAKKTRQGIGVKALTHQVSVDFEQYGTHPNCKLMFCFIYDPEGRIGHPKGLEGDLTLNYNGRRVEALICPK